MNESTSCIGGVDPRAIASSRYVQLKDIENGSLKKCSSCHVAPGGTHHRGCGVERCSGCGRQAIGCCTCEHNPSKTRWTGLWPGVLTCRREGLWACAKVDGFPVDSVEVHSVKSRVNVEWHVPCSADDPFAYEDLNRCAVKIAKGELPLEVT